MPSAISKPTVKVNNEVWPIKPNTAKYTEGEGETEVQTQSAGGGSIEIVTSDSAEDKMSMVSFEMLNTPENIKRARAAKKNPGGNVVELSEGSFSRVVAQASIVNDFEVELSSTGKLALDWRGAPSI